MSAAQHFQKTTSIISSSTTNPHPAPASPSLALIVQVNLKEHIPVYHKCSCFAIRSWLSQIVNLVMTDLFYFVLF
jgi:hypothetical protein